jgi:hypothetical protein
MTAMIPVLRRCLILLAVALVLVGCADDDSSTGPVGVETGSDEQSDEGEPRDPEPGTLGGEGLIGLLGHGSGRVTLRPGAPDDLVLLPVGTATFHRGGLLMVFDEHPAAGRTIEDYRTSYPRRVADMDVVVPPLPDGDPLTQRASLGDLIAAATIPSDTFLGLWGPDCIEESQRARERLRASPAPVQQWLPDVGGEIWDYPASAFPEVPACVDELFSDFGEEGDASPEQRLRFHRSADGRRLTVMFDSGLYADGRFEPLLVLVIDESGDDEIPADPGSSPAIDVFNPWAAFVLAVNDCGGLPWAYSNFMAGDSYTGPDEPGYAEPGPFTSAYACEDAVPERR